MMLFLFINSENFQDLICKFEKDICEIVENRIEEIKKDEFDILNEDIHERCTNGEFGLRCRKLNWWKEIFITIFILCLIAVVVCLNNC